MSCNGTNSSENPESNETEDRSPPPAATPMDLIRNPNIRKKFFILAFDWVANAVVYNGLSYNATNLGVSDYLAFFIGKTTTFPLVTSRPWPVDWRVSRVNTHFACTSPRATRDGDARDLSVPYDHNRRALQLRCRRTGGDTLVRDNVVRDGSAG